jgi:hypothetical protein
LNLYKYVRNDPVNRSDPTGTQSSKKQENAERVDKKGSGAKRTGEPTVIAPKAEQGRYVGEGEMHFRFDWNSNKEKNKDGKSAVEDEPTTSSSNKSSEPSKLSDNTSKKSAESSASDSNGSSNMQSSRPKMKHGPGDEKESGSGEGSNSKDQSNDGSLEEEKTAKKGYDFSSGNTKYAGKLAEKRHKLAKGRRDFWGNAAKRRGQPVEIGEATVKQSDEAVESAQRKWAQWDTSARKWGAASDWLESINKWAEPIDKLLIPAEGYFQFQDSPMKTTTGKAIETVVTTGLLTGAGYLYGPVFIFDAGLGLATGYSPFSKTVEFVGAGSSALVASTFLSNKKIGKEKHLGQAPLTTFEDQIERGKYGIAGNIYSGFNESKPGFIKQIEPGRHIIRYLVRPEIE